MEAGLESRWTSSNLGRYLSAHVVQAKLPWYGYSSGQDFELCIGEKSTFLVIIRIGDIPAKEQVHVQAWHPG